MKQKLVILLALILLTVVLAGLNAASYVQREKTPDAELTPNRSSFNSGATGSQALYTVLYETGRKVTRWQEPPSGLLTDKKNTNRVFVVIGAVKSEFTKGEISDLLQWVQNGGRLVMIDRDPPEGLVKASPRWQLSFTEQPSLAIFTVDPSDQKQMVGDTPALRPAQPGLLTANVNAIQPSQFIASIALERTAGTGTGTGYAASPPPKYTDDDPDDGSDLLDQPSKAPPPKVQTIIADAPVTGTDKGPTVYFSNAGRNYLIDIPLGQGRIIYLSDPYIVSNAGIVQADNAQLAINLVGGTEGTIAFDEYHQGYSLNSIRFLEFFEGTPVVAIFLQGIVLIGFIFFSQSRRFSRAVPEHEPDRMSKLEYVAAMAELQQRTRAWDLAIENVYTEFRRRSTRLLGLDNMTVKCPEIAAAIADRTGLATGAIHATLFKCEEIIRGEPTNKREVVALFAELRELEAKLGIKRSAGR